MSAGEGPGKQLLQTVQAIDRIFKARSVAVVGVSSDPAKLGYMTLESILKGGYDGRVYPVNPRGGELLGHKVYKRLSQLPGRPDLVVILVPARFVPGVLREAAGQGIPGAVILSAGFREAGRADLEEEIAAIARETGLRFAGPNIQGINYLPNKLCAMFFPVITTRGPLAVVAQSGSVTAALSEWAADEGLGISAAINLGNQTDLCEADYLEYFSIDENTGAVALYLEGIKNGRRFLEAAARATLRKPVAVLKAGRSETGRLAASSHTGSLAGRHEVFSGACRQFGLINAGSLDTLYDYARGLAALKEPRGNRVLSISTSGGMGTLAADEAGAEGLVLPPLPDGLVREIQSLGISPLAHLANPIDLGYVPSEGFKPVVLLADKYEAADIILLNLGDPMPGMPEIAVELAGRIKAALAVSYAGGGEEEKKGRPAMMAAGIPVFSSPERAIRGIGAAVRAARFRRERQAGEEAYSLSLTDLPLRDRAAESRLITEPEVVQYLKRYNIPYPEHGLARSAEEAVKIAAGTGYPVVLKIVSPDVAHKSDAGGVITGLETPSQVREAYDRILARVLAAVPGASIEGVLVCRQAPQGLEVIVGALEDEVFGPAIMFGLGGIFTEVFQNVSFRIAPLMPFDAAEMIRETKAYPLLRGIRGQTPCDIQALEQLLLAVSRLVMEHREIKELDLNPVRVFKEGLLVLDARMGVFVGMGLV
jgi:acyl-CoA synthetase (NDP forming)